MKRLSVLFMLVLLAVYGLPVHAQRSKPINVYITVERPNPNIDDRANHPTVPFPGCTVYIFDTKAKAQQFYNLNKMDDEGSGLMQGSMDGGASYKETLTTDVNGICEASAVGSTWYIVAFQYPYLSKRVVSIDGNTELTIEMESQVRELQNVTKTEKRKRQRTKVRNLAVGDTRIVQAEIQIYPEERNSKVRYGISPFSTVAGNTYAFTSAYQNRTPTSDPVFKYMRPYVIDGEDYKKTQLRKVGYVPENDPLAAYVDKNQVVKTRDEKNDTLAFHIYEVLRPVKQDALYPTYGYKWYENFGNLEITDTVLIDAGYAHFPMRFIDFAFPEVEINKANYHIPPKREAQKGDAKLDIKFVNGKAEVLPTDTAGLEQLATITRALERIHTDPDGRLYEVSIHGYASPEGGRAINESLCKQRAAYLKQKVVARLNGVPASVEGSVATWKDVADLLRADSLADPENLNRARQIEDIIASSRDEHQIDAKMSSSPLYKFLKEHEDKYYRPLRKVVISYEFSMQRILSREEVIERYEKKKDDIFLPYQYEFLFDYLQEKPKELEAVAKSAMKYGPMTAIGKPWPLAAYYLAKCYTERDTCDASLLAPYIALSDEQCIKEVPYSRMIRSCSTLLNSQHVDEEGVFIQHMNDEGIVMQQISMLVKANKIFEAFRLSDNLLPDEDPKYRQPKSVLECMDGSWTVPEVRDAVASTSEWNKVVVYAAQDENPGMDEAYWEDAWTLLNDTTVFSLENPRELYMKATLARRLYTSAKNWNSRKDEVPVPKHFFDKGDYTIYSRPSLEDESYPWGYAMIRACELNPSFINTLKFDGEFNQNYRDGFAAYWNDIHPDKILK